MIQAVLYWFILFLLPVPFIFLAWAIFLFKQVKPYHQQPASEITAVTSSQRTCSARDSSVTGTIDRVSIMPTVISATEA